MEEATERSSDNPGNLPAITPVGNGWILCRSKSHGRVYYFNTLTGEAVWNLSNEEFQKAKKCTGKLPLNYPEPQEPPGDLCNHESQLNGQSSQYATPKVYNKQIINNQFTRPPYSPFVASCHCSPLNRVPNMIGVTTQPPFNPVWIQPPPIFLTNQNPSTSNINQTENVGHHHSYQQRFTVQDTSASFSRCFAGQNHKSFPNRPHGIGKFTKNMNNKYNTRKQPFIPNRMPNRNQKDIGDLRSKLSARRTSQSEILKDTQEANLNKSEEAANFNKITQESQTSTPLENSHIEDVLFAETDNEWLKLHGVIVGAKLKLDVKSLKNLATENTECECWYIVVDKNVLMKHFNLLKVLTTSDEQCKLMIVREVMSELQAAARADGTKDEARRVMRGLSQLFAVKDAVIAEYSFKPSEMKDRSGMVNFCTMLRQQNEHVVLLTNEERIQKHLSKVPTFTIPEVKELLINDKNKLIKIVTPIIERNITITIPNEIAENEVYNVVDENENINNEMDTTEYVEATPAYGEKLTSNHNEITVKNKEKTVSDVATIPDLETTSDYLKATGKINNTTRLENNSKPLSTNKKETNIQTDVVVDSVVKMVDAEVQTDYSVEFLRPIIQKDSVGVNTVDEYIDESCYIDIQTNVDNSGNEQNNTMSNQEIKTRENRLKRSISNQTVKSNNELSDKWHRKKRDGSLAFSDSASSLDDRISRVTNAPFENNAHSSHFTCVQDAMCQPRSQSTQMYYDDFGQGSDSSSCVVMRKTPNDNITIEETSTSDIISNSMSNADSENLNEINISREKNEKSDIQIKNVMFEITSKAMEQNLKMRCDEWLAQFIQIMEEVLARVLEKESKDIVKTMPPPWTLHEATECVKRTFNNDSDVLDAATKLSHVIYRMSDAKGKIIVNFKPNEFMELYSYGVYLVDALQNILEKFEDIQIAAESLTQLLSDIENPIADSGSFGDTTGVSVVVSESSNEEAANKTPSMISKKSSSPRKNQKVADEECKGSPGKYNLRSASKKKVNEDSNVEISTVKFVRKINIREDFFTSLHLQRKDETANSTTKIIQDNAARPTNNTAKEIPTNKSPGANKPAEKGPNIIRNFTKCLDFEEKLRKQSREPLDMDMLDYSVGNEDEYDNMEEEYSGEYDEVNEFNTEERNKISEKDFTDSANNSQVDDNNNNYEVLVSSIVKEIKKTIVKVHSFCEKAKDELQSINMPNSRKIELYNKAHMANLHISNMCSNLGRLKERVNQNSGEFQSRLKESGFLLNEKEILAYRDVINSCIEHGDNLLELLNLIMDAVRI